MYEKNNVPKRKTCIISLKKNCNCCIIECIVALKNNKLLQIWTFRNHSTFTFIPDIVELIELYYRGPLRRRLTKVDSHDSLGNRRKKQKWLVEDARGRMFATACG